MALRVVIVTTLLICAFAIELILRPSDTLRPLFLLAAAAYGTVLLYAVLDRWLKGTPGFVLLQLVGDAMVITCFVQITGGLGSPMSFLYLMPISVGSMMLYRRGGLAMAGICWALYASLFFVGRFWSFFGGMPSAADFEPGNTVYLLMAHLVAMLAFALLSSYLSERLRTQGQELAERQRAVARLKALNENIIESINSGLITTDLGGQINFMNRGGAEITALTQREVEERRVEQLFGLEEDFLAEIRRRLLEERRFRFERYFERDGKRIFLGIAASNLYDKTGHPLGYIFIFQDLTEIHALEQEMRLNERMVALGEMAAGMAHELRNPLAAISGSVQYLKGDLKPHGETLELMDIILRESQRLDQAIRDFLTFARPGKFTRQRVDLTKLFDDNIKLLRRSEEFRSCHRLETDFPDGELWCEVDANRMKQVFWNLATNSLKAMPAGGVLKIQARQGVGQLEICFTDEGQGMDDSQKERYFQPFSGSFDEGTGLGAAIVYRLVEEHSGKIHVDSQKDSGTAITIVLPDNAAPVTSLSAPIEGGETRLRAAGGLSR
jgi:two-component system sensor histidine kinase PilS (NtrC family)